MSRLLSDTSAGPGESRQQNLVLQLQALLALASQAHDQEERALRATKDLQVCLQSLVNEEEKVKGLPDGLEVVPSERTPIQIGDYIVPPEGEQANEIRQSKTGPTFVLPRRTSDGQTEVAGAGSYGLVESLTSMQRLGVSSTMSTDTSKRPNAKVLRASLDLGTRIEPTLDLSSSASTGSDETQPVRSVLKRMGSDDSQVSRGKFAEEEGPRNMGKMNRIQSMHAMRNMTSTRDTVRTLGVINKLFGENPMNRRMSQDFQESTHSEPSDDKDSDSGTASPQEEEQLQALANQLEALTQRKSTKHQYTGFELRPVWLFDEDLADMVTSESSLIYKIRDGLQNSLAVFLRRSSTTSNTNPNRRVPRISTDSAQSETIRSKSATIRCLVLHPNSPKRAFWDTCGIFMICFDIFTLPLTAFDPEDNWFFTFMGWASQLFWNFDIIASFFTGYIKDGIAVMVPFKIARHYLKHWFAFDLTIVGVDWLLYVLVRNTERSTASATRVSKMSRMLRFLRTIRLLKVFKINAAQDILEEVFDVFASESAYTQLSIVKIMICILCINHFIACIWYAIGNSEDGWVVDSDMRGRELLHRYACSYHWSVSQFGVGNVGIEAKSTAEHIYSVMVLLCALVLFSCLVSSATNALARYQQNRTDELRQFGLFRRFCRQVGIPRQLTKRALNYLEYESRQLQRNIDHNEVGLLNRLSEPLVAELMYYKYLPHMQTNPLFGFLCHESSLVMHKVAIEALTSKMGGRNDVMLNFGQQADEVLFVMNGELQYSWRQEADSVVGIQVGQWVGEPALWTMWLYLGDLIAIAGCNMLVVDVEKFGEAISKNPEIWGTVVMYAGAFVQHLKNTYVNLLTDVRTPDQVYPFEELFEKSSRRKTQLHFHFPGQQCLGRFQLPGWCNFWQRAYS